MALRIAPRPAASWLLLLVSVAPQAGSEQPGCLAELARWGWGTPTAVALEGDTLAFGSGSIFVLADVSDPERPTITGSVTLPRAVTAVELRGGLAVVGGGADAIWLVDVSDRSAPRVLGNPLPGGDFGLEGELLAIVRDDILRVMDVAQVPAPVERGRLSLPKGSGGLLVDGTVAYVGSPVDDISSPEDGLSAIDLSDPTAPRRLAFVDVHGTPAALDHGLLALNDAWSGTHFLDVTDPAAPSLRGSSPIWGEYSVSDVALDWPIAYVASDPCYELQVLDVSGPSGPVMLSVRPDVVDNPHAIALRVDLLVTAGDTGVSAYHRAAAGPGALGLLGRIATPATPAVVAAAGDAACVIDRLGRSSLLRLGTPPSAGAELPAATNAVTDGRTAILATAAGQVTVADVRDPAHPTTTALRLWEGIDSPNRLGSPALAIDRRSGTLTLVATREWDPDTSRILVLDVTDPASPFVASTALSLAGQNAPPDVLLGLDGRLAAVGVEDSVTLLDLADPARPEVGGSIGVTAHRLAVTGKLVLALTLDGLVVIDGSRPARPTVLSTLPAGQASPIDLAADGAGRAFVLEDLAGVPIVRMVDVSDPARPTERGRLALPDGARSLDLAGRLLVVNEQEHGIALLDAASCPLEVRHPLRRVRRSL